jgi:hypothetical protein
MHRDQSPGDPDDRLPSRREVVRRGGLVAGAAMVSSAPLLGQTPAPGSPPGRRFDVRAMGASGRRADNATAVFRAAVDACTAAGGGLVYVPPGEYTVGTIHLKDNVTLHLEAGATLFLSQTREDFDTSPRTMIWAENATNIGVTGRGTLDGLAQYVFTEMRGVDPEIAEEIEIARAAGIDMRRYYRTGMQTYMVILNGCRQVLLRDVSIIHSPLWTVRLNDCDRVHVDGVYILSDLERGVNADGIDIVSSQNVLISDSIIVTGDDAIVLKAIGRGGQPARPVENITVTNCILTSSSTPLMIGTETQADIRHVLFSNCVIRNSNKGFGINVQDGAVVSDVVYSNLTIETSRRHWNWWGSSEMCKFVLKQRNAKSPVGAIRDIVIDNVIARPRGTSTMTGHATRPLENIRMSNVQLHMLPEDAKDKRATHALRVEGVSGLGLRDVSMDWADETEPKWGSAVALRRVTDFRIEAFRGRQGLAGTETPVLVIEDCVDGAIVDARATAGARRFLHVEGEATRDITVRDIRMSDQGQTVTFGGEALRARVQVR